jgi:GH15 family glucan-1,4-alpha-glucosidase
VGPGEELSREDGTLPSYLPIAEHGLIGDLHTAALVGVDGTIDWYCCPRFDAPSVFAAILDRSRGGFWRIAPSEPGWTSKQLYFPDTNILITRFLSPDGGGEVQDFMPIASSPAHPAHSLIRRVVCVRGKVDFETDVEPRFDTAANRTSYARTSAGRSSRPPRFRSRWPRLGRSR